MPTFSGEVSGRMAAGGGEQIDLKTRWNWHPPGQPAFQGEGFASGDRARVLIRQTLNSPLPAELSAVIQHPLQQPEWTAQLDVPEFLARQAHPDWAAWPVSLNLRGEGRGTIGSVAGEGRMRVPGVGQATGELQARYQWPGEIRLEQLVLNLPETRLHWRLSGAVRQLDQQPELTLAMDWERLAWPLKQPQWRSPRGHIALEGPLRDVVLAGEAQLGEHPVTLAGHVGRWPDRTVLQAVRVEGAGLNIQLDGVVGPQVDVSWTLQGEQLGQVLPGAHGRIRSRGRITGPRDRPAGVIELMARDVLWLDHGVRELTLQLQGGLAPGSPPLQATLQLAGLRAGEVEAGRVQLTGQGGFEWRDGQLLPVSNSFGLQLAGQALRYGVHQVRELQVQAAGGLLPGSPPFDTRLKAHDLRVGEATLADLNLQLKGGIVRRDGDWMLQGEPLVLQGQAEHLVSPRARARGMSLRLRAGAQPDAPFELAIRAPDLRLDGQPLTLDIDGQGTRARQGLSGRALGSVADAAAKPQAVSLAFRLEGGWKAGQWAGLLQQLDGRVGSLGEWHLSHPARLVLAPDAGELGQACWESRATTACLQGQLQPRGWQLASRLNGFELERLRAWVPAELALTGRLEADAQFAGQGAQVLDGRFDLHGEGVQIDYAGQQAPLRFHPEPLSLRGTFSGRGAELSLRAEQPDFATLRADLSLGHALVLTQLRQTVMNGELRLELRHLGVLMPLSADIEKVQGRLEAGVRFAGTPAQPRLQAHGTLFDAGFTVPRLGIRVRSLNADAVSHDDNQLSIHGRGVSGSGELRLEGHAGLSPGQGWPVSLALTGNRFLAADIPEAKVYLSPDLRIEHRDDRLTLSGRITVPEATIQIPDESGAIKPSRDVIIVEGDAPPESRSLLPETHVTLVLGNKIKVTGPGYHARVDGEVTVDQLPGNEALGSGEIRIHDGLYTLYGVELVVDGGRLVFVRSPMDNPQLDLRAVRKTEEVVAGAKLLGTLAKPNITLFADKPMSQTDILAYLMMGKPFDPLNQQKEGSAMMAAANALGGTAGSVLAKELSSRLGLGSFVDISMQSSLRAGGLSQGYGGSGPWGGTQSTALFLGKYLTPKIYAQYGMGLFQNAYVFRLRYDLTERWKVQTETGEYSGGDLLYQWED